MTPKKRKKPKTALEKMSDKQLLKSIRKDLHTMVIEAEAALLDKPKKSKR
jgi:hypothetical protein